MFHKLIAWFKTEVEHIHSFIKTGSLIAPLIGLYYFLAYLRSLGIPFPADFSVLPSVLSTIGIVTVFMLLVLSVYIFMAAWIQTDPFDVGYAELIHKRPSGFIGYGGRATIVNLMAVYVVPYFAMVYVLYKAPQKEVAVYLHWLLISYGVWTCIFSGLKVREQKKMAWKEAIISFIKIAMSVFSLIFITLFSSCICFLILGNWGLMKTPEQILLSLASFLVVNIALLYPRIDTKSFELVNKEIVEAKGAYALALTKKIYRAPTPLIVALPVVISLLPPLSEHVGEMAIKFLGLSSNVGRVFYSDSKIGKSWPSSLRSKCDADGCESVPVIVVLDLGKYLYIRPKDGGDLHRIERLSVVERFLKQEEPKA